ncbi:MAG TPA: lytic transglycosylase domain-containing protein [Candidatus Rifleibacterium sp.]|nr:lytic transglycosylase domain-containing protein [Candidatus Rifleibacterium sp.]HPT46750.1 lytic transglycosylase domain-containing protein [Candidatus Rifleibacterium sp.]
MKLNLKLKFPVLALTFLLLTSLSAAGQSFDRSLDELFRLNSGNRHAEVLNRLASLQASPELADLRLFFEAEALKNLGRKAEAYALYDKIIRQYAGTETAFQSQMPHFMLQLDTVTPAGLPKLEAEAAGLSTPWQRGTAFQKLSELALNDRANKSRLALNSLRQFGSDKAFYKTAPAGNEILKKMLHAPAEFAFSDDEWLEILLVACQENLIGEFFKQPGASASLLGKYGQPAIDLFKAESLRQQKKLPQAMEIFNALIKGRRATAPLLALVYQLRGDANHFAENHAAAAADYHEALKYRKFPVNVMAAEYRLMRSAFKIGRDAECLEILGRISKNTAAGTLLPVHIYEMGLECYDAGQKDRAVPFFMLLPRSFPGHHRADDALGYAALAVGEQSAEGQSIIKLLKKKYPNSFYITWVAPAARDEKLVFANSGVAKLDARLQNRVAAMKKLWKTQYASMARAEAMRITDANPGNHGLYKAIIDVARDNADYSTIVAYGERLARQILEADRSLTEMPEWGWKALYPVVFEDQVRANAKKFGIDPFWILSIMREESHFKVDTLSRSNAMSLMQILPSTGKWIAGKLGEKGFKKDDLWNVDLNIRYGSWYLRYLADLFNGDLFLASASYNGGQGNIQRKVEAGPYAGLPVLERLDRVPLPETRDYYKKVMGSHLNYTRLYRSF